MGHDDSTGGELAMLAFRNPPETWRVFSYILMGNHGKSLNNAGFSIAHL
jgi:hypothetical protein